MSREEYQRAMADLLRQPAFCGAVAREDEALADYDLNADERQLLRSVAGRAGMRVNCMLYRASRLVGITRRAPAVVEQLGSSFRSVFDAYVAARPDAPAEFDREAEAFVRFVRAVGER